MWEEVQMQPDDIRGLPCSTIPEGITPTIDVSPPVLLHVPSKAWVQIRSLQSTQLLLMLGGAAVVCMVGFTVLYLVVTQVLAQRGHRYLDEREDVRYKVRSSMSAYKNLS